MGPRRGHKGRGTQRRCFSPHQGRCWHLQADLQTELFHWQMHKIYGPQQCASYSNEKFVPTYPCANGLRLKGSMLFHSILRYFKASLHCSTVGTFRFNQVFQLSGHPMLIYLREIQQCEVARIKSQNKAHTPYTNREPYSYIDDFSLSRNGIN